MGGSMSNQSEMAMPPLEALNDRLVDADRMMGLWYVTASIPTPFEKGAHNATEMYQWEDSATKQAFTVTFGFNKGSFEGKHRQLFQKGALLLL
jgi:apolipoprotein D and lipocalin family protein